MSISRKASWKREDLSGSFKKGKGERAGVQRAKDKKKHGLLRVRLVV